jgi:hypothetical protein
MSTETYYGFVRNGTVMFPEGVPVPAEGTIVTVSPTPPHSGAPGALLAALATTPPVPEEWVDELERLIAEGGRPPLKGSPFMDDSDEEGA